jgi:uncharacterized protein YndB with AHSA1/START domain
MTENNQATVHVAGTLQSVGGRGVIRMEGRYDTDIEDLWSALTEPQRLARWIAQVDGDLRLGGEFKATFTSTWEGSGRVDVCEPPRHLVVTMCPRQEDETIWVANLATDGDQTILVIEDRGLPLDELASHGAGWQAHFEDLAAHLAGRDPTNWHARWIELTPSYRAMPVGRASSGHNSHDPLTETTSAD